MKIKARSCDGHGIACASRVEIQSSHQGKLVLLGNVIGEVAEGITTSNLNASIQSCDDLRHFTKANWALDHGELTQSIGVLHIACKVVWVKSHVWHDMLGSVNQFPHGPNGSRLLLPDACTLQLGVHRVRIGEDGSFGKGSTPAHEMSMACAFKFTSVTVS